MDFPVDRVRYLIHAWVSMRNSMGDNSLLVLDCEKLIAEETIG
jgi:hypothetical protein